MLALRHTLIVLAVPLSLSVGCFDDPGANTSNTTNAENGSETGDGACPDGSAGCDCYGNGTCDTDLECIDGTCKLPECLPGSLNCDCYEGVCLSGLVCMDGLCKPEDPMMGCESVSDCDQDLCTQGDAVCEDSCVPGLGVQCPTGAMCDPGSGSCECEPGSKPCGSECIAESQCCMDTDCGAGSSCQGGFCTCEGGLDCNGNCIPNAMCCPGEITSSGCMCGAKKTCNEQGMWGQCQGGNPEPKCSPGEITPCGDHCGSQTCTADCNWSPCEGEGPCTPYENGCSGPPDCAPLTCNLFCFWEPNLQGEKCC
jgi:hypothetical protein